MLRKLFTLVLCLATTVIAVQAQTQTPPDNEIWYTTTDGKIAELNDSGTPCSGNGRDFKIISHFYKNGKGVIRANKPIKSYGGESPEDGFTISGNVESIILPNCLTIIGGSFSGCSSLKNINIPDSVKYIDDWGEHFMFRGCNNLPVVDNIRYADTYLVGVVNPQASYTIKEGTRFIANYAFGDCSSLRSITIPNSVTKIGFGAFSGCSNLTSITIPDSVTFIDEYAFSGCTSLKNVTIGNGVTGLYYAFQGCSSLKNVTIGNSVTKIGDSSFAGCRSLTSITIPDSVTEIGDCAFEGCNINSVVIDVTTGNTSFIENYFGANKIIGYTGKYASADGCCFIKKGVLVKFIDKNRTEYTIPNGVTSIGKEAFSGCSSLTSITIPDSVTTIGKLAFARCSSLKNVNVNITDLAKYCTNNVIYNIPGNKHLYIDNKEITELTIPDSVTTIGKYAFNDCNSLTSVTIPDSVTSIGARAFDGCGSLTSITIPDSVTSIGYGAFNDCSSLTNVTIGNGVNSIGNYAFSDCSSLTNITIPDSVTAVKEEAFSGCPIRSVTVNATTGNISSIESIFGRNKIVAFIGKYASEDGLCLIINGKLIDFIYKRQTEYTIPDGVTSIGEKTFYGCRSLINITIPNSVTSIGEEVFHGCTNLASIKCLVTTPPTIHDLAISDTTLIYVPKEAIKAYKKAPNWSRYKKRIKPIK